MKKYIQEQLDIDMIDKSLNEPIQSEDERLYNATN